MAAASATDPEVDRLSTSVYVALTTYRRDGSPVTTPVWVSGEADHLYVWTQAGTGKVRRIANNSRVMVAPCDVRGTPQGTGTEATARLLSGRADIDHVRALHARKYGVRFRLFDIGGRLFRRGNGGQIGIGIEITPV